jgi:exopolyphosphatase/guanosine-5'-triphosphate,3'-diphosphate pyrophosphatase
VLSGGAGYRRILEAAGLVHDVGRNKGEAGHLKRGYRMITRLKPPLGWNEEELRCVAAVARYHRGALPKTTDSYFVGLTARRRSALLPIMGILRLANAFDASHDRKVTGVSVEQHDGTLNVYAQGLQEISETAERLAQARYLLETTSSLAIRIRPLPEKPAASSRSHIPARRVAAGS